MKIYWAGETLLWCLSAQLGKERKGIWTFCSVTRPEAFMNLTFEAGPDNVYTEMIPWCVQSFISTIDAMLYPIPNAEPAELPLNAGAIEFSQQHKWGQLCYLAWQNTSSWQMIDNNTLGASSLGVFVRSKGLIK